MPPAGLLVTCPPREAAMPPMHITIAALPLARLCRFSISLQRCHLSDFIAWVPVYSHTTGQTLLLWFELAVPTLVRL